MNLAHPAFLACFAVATLINLALVLLVILVRDDDWPRRDDEK